MVARRAHNPKVVGSNPASATINQPLRLVFLCLNLIVFQPYRVLLCKAFYFFDTVF